MSAGEYTLQGPDDFVRLDRRCAELLQAFCRWLQAGADPLPPEAAGALAHAADRYLRDFVVDIKESGPADEDPTLARQYLSNWYIIHTLVPTHEEVERIRDALCRLYDFLSQARVLSPEAARKARAALADAEFFHRRLEDFWELTPEAIPGWRSVDDYRTRRRLQ